MTGEELRDQGIEQAGSGMPVGVMVSWADKAKWAIMKLCLADANFCADDVRRAAGDPPTPNAMGGAFQAAYKQGLIVPAGFGLAHRPERHASVLRYWRRR